jgi:hypothetical protein
VLVPCLQARIEGVDFSKKERLETLLHKWFLPMPAPLAYSSQPRFVATLFPFLRRHEKNLWSFVLSARSFFDGPSPSSIRDLSCSFCVHSASIGAASRRNESIPEIRLNSQAMFAYNKKMDTFKRGFSACMDARGYSVK